MDKPEKTNSLEDSLDQINISIFSGKLNREDLHIYIPFQKAVYYYRINLHPKLESECQILCEKEIFEDASELYEKARAKAQKFDEVNYDAAAVLFVQDVCDPPVEDTFGFTIEQKLKLSVLLYVLKGNMPEDTDTNP